MRPDKKPSRLSPAAGESSHLPPQFKVGYVDDNSSEYQEKHDAVRRYRQQIAPWLVYGADRLSMHQRQWFRISEIVDHCASIPGDVKLDQGKQERAIELMRKSILVGEFDDASGRSKIANLHPAFAAELRFARGSAAEPDYFRPWVSYLWIRRLDCEAWFERNGLEFPKAWLLDKERHQLRQGRAATQNSPLRYPLTQKPSRPAAAFAHYVLLDRWGAGGPPRSMSIRQITEDANQHRLGLPANKDYAPTPGGISASTVRRVLGLSK